MLPRRYRLKRGNVFKKTMSSGQTCFACPYFLVLGLPKLSQSPPGPTQFAIITSKKVSNRAHKRNLIRRRLHALLQQHQTTLQNTPWHAYRSIIMITRPSILEASYQTLQETFIKWLSPTA